MVREVDLIGPRDLLASPGSYLPVSGLTPAGSEIRGEIAVRRFRSAAGVPVSARPVMADGPSIFIQN